MQSSVYDDDALFKLWCTCLMKATYKKREVVFNGEIITLLPGQFITGRKALAEELNTTERKVRTRLQVLEKLQNVTIRTTKRFSVITVINWDIYQGQDEKRPSERPTDDQQTTTNKKGKKEKNTTPPSGEDNQIQDMNSFQNARRYSEEHGYQEDAVQTDPEYKANKAKKSGKASDDQMAVFELFNNPAKALWRMREIEREAAQVLFDTYGLETLEKRITRIEKLKQNEDPYLPQVDTPSELLDKMPKVERYLKQTS